MAELETQLRRLVDASAPPVTYQELMARLAGGDRHTRPSRRQRSAGVGLAAAALIAVVVITVVAAILLIGRQEDGARITTQPATSPGSYPSECLRTSASPNNACPRSLEQAETMLGLPLRSPRFVPDSWVSVRRVVFVTPAGSQGNPEDVAAFNQVWAPPGTDLASRQANYLQIRQQAAFPNEANTCIFSRYQLEDGSTACGTMTLATSGPNEPVHDYAFLDWVKDGVRYHVQVVGLAPDVVLRVLNSLH